MLFGCRWWAGIALVAASVMGHGCSGKSAPEKPRHANAIRHVVVISLDTVRPDHLGYDGSSWVKTPELDKLASQSIVLSNLHTAATTTLASHVALFTGTYPHTHRVPRNGFEVHGNNLMLTEILKEKGFRTAAFLGAIPLSRVGFSQGFDHYDEPAPKDAERSAEELNARVAAYLERQGVPENLFLFIHYWDAHDPYVPKPPYDSMYTALDARTLYPTLDREQDLPVQRSIARKVAHPSLVNVAAQLYAGEISYLDHSLGGLLSNLKKTGILEEALLVIVSDHGETLWDHRPFFDHGATTYQAETRIVGLVRFPGGKGGGKKDARLMSNIDLLPSILYAMGSSAGRVEGTTFDLLQTDPAEKAANRVIYSEATKPHESVETGSWVNDNKNRCAFDGRFKLMETPWANDSEMMERVRKDPKRWLAIWGEAFFAEQRGSKLFDLSTDPHERANLLESSADAKVAAPADSSVQKLQRALREWAASASPVDTRPTERTTDEKYLEKLRSLGYL